MWVSCFIAIFMVLINTVHVDHISPLFIEKETTIVKNKIDFPKIDLEESLLMNAEQPVVFLKVNSLHPVILKTFSSKEDCVKQSFFRKLNTIQTITLICTTKKFLFGYYRLGLCNLRF